MSIQRERFIFDSQLKADQSYWLAKLAREIGDSSLPPDRPRGPCPAGEPGSAELIIDGELYRALAALAGGSAFLIYTTLMAALKICLAHYTRNKAIVIGSPAYIEKRPADDPVNIVAIVDQLDTRRSFRQLLVDVRQTLVDAYAHQRYPFQRLMKDLGLAQPDQRCVLFEIVLALSEIHGRLPDIRNDITISFDRQPHALAGQIVFDTAIFHQQTFARFARHFVTLLRRALDDIDRPIGSLSPLPPEEEQHVLVGWNATGAPYPHEECLHTLFEAQVARTPDAIALVFERPTTNDQRPTTNDQRPTTDEGQTVHPLTPECLTYRELNTRANQLAHELRKLGVGPDVAVGICVEPSLDMAVGVLGILKAGGAYVPLDPTYPAERLAFMLETAQAPVLLTQQSFRQLLPAHGRHVLCLDSDWSSGVKFAELQPASYALSANLAYLIFTSGSTGRPKGIGLPHSALVNLLVWHLASLLGAARTLQFASLSFDASCHEMFAAWLSGGTLYILPSELRRDIPSLARFIRAQAIEKVILPVVVLQQLAEEFRRWEQLPDSLREVTTTGEQLQVTAPVISLFQRLAGCPLHNHYGPSESHVVTAYTLPDAPETWPTHPSIGRPVANSQMYILDEQLRPVALGALGELYIGGANLARGYQGRPELTAEKFVPNPFADQRPTTNDQRPTENQEPRTENQEPRMNNEALTQHSTLKTQNSRLYKTGDLARYLPDGNIEFLGRLDHQVKIRGFRVELGEVEAVLQQHADVQVAMVIAQGDTPTTKRLVAYVVPTADHRPTTNDQRQGDKETRGQGDSDHVTDDRPPTTDDRPPSAQRLAPSAQHWTTDNGQLAHKLRLWLRERLPEYMVPAVVTVLDALPLTPNGKVDRRALPAPELSRPALQQSFVAPQTPAEELVARIWAQLLEIEQVGIHDNFFDLGGHSLLMTQVIAQVRDIFMIDVPLRQLFDRPTVVGLVESIAEAWGERDTVEKIAETFQELERLPAAEIQALLEQEVVPLEAAGLLESQQRDQEIH